MSAALVEVVVLDAATSVPESFDRWVQPILGSLRDPVQQPQGLMELVAFRRAGGAAGGFPGGDGPVIGRDRAAL